jgi:diguanylate cyclase (GGDEF)-like protein
MDVRQTAHEPDMRRVLQLCMEIDELAVESYEAMAAASEEPEVRALFGQMGRDKAAHISWWRRLLTAFDEDRLPRVLGDPLDLVGQLESVIADVRATMPGDLAGMTTDEMLTTAAKVEYFALEPVFGELLDMLGPVDGALAHEAYDNHIERLISAIESQHRGTDSLPGFLVRVLRRSWRNSTAMTSYAMRDPLTGLYNRRALDSYLTQWTAWACRYSRPVSVLMMDIDDFKRVNDRQGHTVGDAALVAVAYAITTSARASDIVGRFGGDEFLLIAPESGPAEIAQVAERVLENVRAMSLPSTNGDGLGLTISVGVAVSDGSAGPKVCTPDSLLTAADAGLYGAKAAGKDRWAAPVVIGTR